jgi:very-short-patch-repair endonuclease
MLLKVLPCWIMSPDDVARLFPCKPGLFDVVIVDEASQCDLPSMTPVLYRSKQAIVVGDSKQMQAQRFAFVSTQVSAQAWHEHGLDKMDPDGWLNPAKVDLLQLASVRCDEEARLDEHYRCLPQIIGFSNDRWYGYLRIMRDADDRRFGAPDAPVISLTYVENGRVNSGTQENEMEARALLAGLRSRLCDPGYSEATFGIICLFEEQMHLVNDLIADEIDEELRAAHELVVVNPDGFQGDERDIIFYSLSYDANGMEKAALSARQAEREHIQGMLNVAFTRAREEMHIFHSAPIEEFGTATGKGTILDWLRYCQRATQTGNHKADRNLGRADSEFEAEVMRELQARGVTTISQYPSCGFFIDIVAEFEGNRIAIECDGEYWHLDEHGKLKSEDVYRQEILVRAGWYVIRIPYRRWRKDRSSEVARVMAALSSLSIDSGSDKDDFGVSPTTLPNGSTSSDVPVLRLSPNEAAIVHAIRSGAVDHEEVLRGARIHLGAARLGSRLRNDLEDAISSLQAQKVVVIEDSDVFIVEAFAKAAVNICVPRAYARRRGRRTRRRYGYLRTSL